MGGGAIKHIKAFSVISPNKNKDREKENGENKKNDGRHAKQTRAQPDNQSINQMIKRRGRGGKEVINIIPATRARGKTQRGRKQTDGQTNWSFNEKSDRRRAKARTNREESKKQTDGQKG